MSKIKSIHGREILDLRGNPTVAVDVVLESGVKGTAGVPPAPPPVAAKRWNCDGDKSRYLGKGVLKAVANVNSEPSAALVGMEAADNRPPSIRR